MKRTITLLLTLLMIFSILTPAALANPSWGIGVSNFLDVCEDAWYFWDVHEARNRGIMQGVSDTHFNPSGHLTRAEVTAIIFRFEHGRRANAQDSRVNNFHDVGSGANVWYAPYVTWAANHGIVSGLGDNRFNPHGRVTRQEFATMVYRYAMLPMGGQHDAGGRSPQWWNFTDINDIAHWALNAMRWMNYHGIITGLPNNTINPNGNATRAEAATMKMRFVRLVDGNQGGPQHTYHTVSFNLAGGTGNFPNIQVRDGTLIPRPVGEPTRPGHVFIGWNWPFDTTVISFNTTISAIWAIDGQVTTTQIENEVVRLINQHRALYGLRPLVPHAGLAELSREHSRDMRLNDFFSHNSPTTGLGFTARVRNSPLNLTFAQYFDPNETRGPHGHPESTPAFVVAEVIASHQTAEGAVRGFLNSPGHRGPLMLPGGWYIGVGVDCSGGVERNGAVVVKLVRGAAPGLTHFLPGGSPPNTHPFNPQP